MNKRLGSRSRGRSGVTSLGNHWFENMCDFPREKEGGENLLWSSAVHISARLVHLKPKPVLNLKPVFRTL